MFHELQTGTRLVTKYGKELVVLDRLGEGGQGVVYRVRYDNQLKALKWYRPDAFIDRTKFIDNLNRNILKGAPTDDFLWPIDMTAVINGSFGYVMDLAPQGYVDGEEFFLHPELWPSFKRIIDACLNITYAFKVLHDNGYCYQDINGGNFFINPKTGKVLICDNDNVAPPGTDTGIRGTPRFMAPEIVSENAVPSPRSDRHSMSVLIFFLMLAQHPLEGRRSVHSVLDGETQVKLYGTEPLFIMDSTSHSNAPDPRVHVNMTNVWPCLPEHTRAFFERAFSQEALKMPSHRPTEANWIYELTRLRSEVVTCTCGNEVFMQDAKPVTCDNPDCKKVVHAPLRAELRNYALPAVRDMRIYRCQTCICDTSEMLDTMVWVIQARGGNVLGVRNISHEPWTLRSGDTEQEVAPNATFFLQEGITLDINDETIDIVRNDQ